MLALDADGTLLDPEGVLRPVVRKAVHRARAAGLRVVICTGRRFRTALQVVEALDLDGTVVLHNGVVVKDIESATTLHHDYLDDDLYHAALEILSGVAPPLVYVDRYHEDIDIVTESLERGHAFQVEYAQDNRRVIRIVESLSAGASTDVVMMSLMADADTLLPIRDAVHAALGDSVNTNFIMNKNYRGHILEIVSAEASKWAALRDLADREGIVPDEIVAIGDDANDREMILNAGFGIAMGNAVDSVKEAADIVTESNADDGIVHALRTIGIETPEG